MNKVQAVSGTGGSGATKGVIDQHGVQPNPTVLGQAFLCPKPSCTGGDVMWEIPAGVLHAIWSDMLPRIVALSWSTGAPLSGPASSPMGYPELRYWMCGIWLAQASPSNPVFQRRWNLAWDYATNPNPSVTRIPLRIVGRGGYDYLLSDAGLDVFVPEEPKSAAEFLRYYTFRGTGRRAIGIPFYLPKADTAMSTESPTGPGQVILEWSLLQSIIGSGSPCAESVKECIVRLMGIQTLPPEPMIPPLHEVIKECLKTHFCDPSEFDSVDDWKACVAGNGSLVTEWIHILREAASEERTRGPSRQVVILAPQTFRCIMGPLRCWQVEGSVFRGMMTEWPRIVATIWMERLQQAPSCPLPLDGYASRYAKAGNSGGPGQPQYGELRKIFEERLETQLHSDEWMRLEVRNGLDDVLVTDQGFLLPPVENLPGSDDRQRLDSIAEEIAAGRAGNPVFTDSMRCEGGGEE
jgi:hypothetical protein